MANFPLAAALGRRMFTEERPNILRTIESAGGLPPSGAQPPEATRAGIGNGPIDAGAFTP